MFTFLAVALTFPTLLFGILLGCAVLYWLLAATGLIELDLFGGDDAGGGGSFSGESGGIAGHLMRFGLGGVPMSLVATVLLLFAWLLSYFATLFVVDGGIWAAPTLSWPVRFAILFGALISTVPLAALSLRPARRFFARLQPAPRLSMLGLSGVVRSPELSLAQGMVAVEDGGAGLILQARDATTDADGHPRFRRVLMSEPPCNRDRLPLRPTAIVWMPKARYGSPMPSVTARCVCARVARLRRRSSLEPEFTRAALAARMGARSTCVARRISTSTPGRPRARPRSGQSRCRQEHRPSPNPRVPRIVEPPP